MEGREQSQYQRYLTSELMKAGFVEEAATALSLQEGVAADFIGRRQNLNLTDLDFEVRIGIYETQIAPEVVSLVKVTREIQGMRGIYSREGEEIPYVEDYNILDLMLTVQEKMEAGEPLTVGEQLVHDVIENFTHSDMTYALAKELIEKHGMANDVRREIRKLQQELTGISDLRGEDLELYRQQVGSSR